SSSSLQGKTQTSLVLLLLRASVLRDSFYLGPNEIKEITEILFAGEMHGEALVNFFYFRTF
ncbi:MAG: hypothetical protein K6F20_06610, partial [Bacteroidaceae bacterium]|nr:hypothetical protein [Bacteroidaceae bacterium]